MILIIESGATKCEWTLVGYEGVRTSFRTGGLNFSSGDSEFIARTLESGILRARDAADNEGLSSIYVYAAGLFPSDEPDSPYMVLYSFFSSAFARCDIHLENDLLAAARAVCGHGAGVACILGTGSNTCVYDGSDIVRKVPSGGFILGDEGSASALGRAFVSDYIKGMVPECVALAFEEKYDMSYPSLVQGVYHGSSPAGFLGSLAPDILAFYDSNHYMRNMVDTNFRAFFERSLLPCINFPAPVPIGIVGGFGYACREIIDGIAAEYGIAIARYLQSPSQQLIAYHNENN